MELEKCADHLSECTTILESISVKLRELQTAVDNTKVVCPYENKKHHLGDIAMLLNAVLILVLCFVIYRGNKRKEK